MLLPLQGQRVIERKIGGTHFYPRSFLNVLDPRESADIGFGPFCRDEPPVKAGLPVPLLEFSGIGEQSLETVGVAHRIRGFA